MENLSYSQIQHQIKILLASEEDREIAYKVGYILRFFWRFREFFAAPLTDNPSYVSWAEGLDEETMNAARLLSDDMFECLTTRSIGVYNYIYAIMGIEKRFDKKPIIMKGVLHGDVKPLLDLLDFLKLDWQEDRFAVEHKTHGEFLRKIEQKQGKKKNPIDELYCIVNAGNYLQVIDKWYEDHPDKQDDVYVANKFFILAKRIDECLKQVQDQTISEEDAKQNLIKEDFLGPLSDEQTRLLNKNWQGRLNRRMGLLKLACDKCKKFVNANQRAKEMLVEEVRVLSHVRANIDKDFLQDLFEDNFSGILEFNLKQRLEQYKNELKAFYALSQKQFNFVLLKDLQKEALQFLVDNLGVKVVVKAFLHVILKGSGFDKNKAINLLLDELYEISIEREEQRNPQEIASLLWGWSKAEHFYWPNEISLLAETIMDAKSAGEKATKDEKEIIFSPLLGYQEGFIYDEDITDEEIKQKTVGVINDFLELVRQDANVRKIYCKSMGFKDLANEPVNRGNEGGVTEEKQSAVSSQEQDEQQIKIQWQNANWLAQIKVIVALGDIFPDDRKYKVLFRQKIRDIVVAKLEELKQTDVWGQKSKADKFAQIREILYQYVSEFDKNKKLMKLMSGCAGFNTKSHDHRGLKTTTTNREILARFDDELMPLVKKIYINNDNNTGQRGNSDEQGSQNQGLVGNRALFSNPPAQEQNINPEEIKRDKVVAQLFGTQDTRKRSVFFQIFNVLSFGLLGFCSRRQKAEASTDTPIQDWFNKEKSFDQISENVAGHMKFTV